jgi:hypothetical protein
MRRPGRPAYRRREQPKRVPPVAPCVADPLVLVQDHGRPVSLLQLVGRGEAGLAAGGGDRLEVVAVHCFLLDCWIATLGARGAASSPEPANLQEERMVKIDHAPRWRQTRRCSKAKAVAAVR